MITLHCNCTGSPFVDKDHKNIMLCVQSWCDKYAVSTSSFSEWKETVISAIHKSVIYLWTKKTIRKSKNTLKLKDKIITEELEMLRNKFFVFRIDYTSSNVVFSAKDIVLEFWLMNLV